jgi:hypothetical protein
MPSVTGLDNSKVGTLLGDPGQNNGDGKKLASDIEIITAKGGKLEDYPGLAKLNSWWQSTGKPHAAEDTKPISDARFFGGKHALLYTAVVPAALAIGFLLLLLYFGATGGYKQVHLEQEQPMGEY